MKITMLNAYSNEPDCTHWNGLNLAFKELGIEYNHIDVQQNDKNQMLAKLRDNKADLVIYGMTDPFYKNYYKEAREIIDCPIALWYADYRDDLTEGALDLDLKDYIDFMFVSNDYQKQYWKDKIGVEAHFVPQAGTPVDEIVYDEKEACDMSFIGCISDWGFLKPRGDMITEIMSKTNLTHINEGPREKRMEVYRRMPAIYGSSKICLDISHIWYADKYTSNRYYTIANCGGFSLCKRFPRCEELFPNKVGKVYWDTIDELLELTKHYLTVDKERREIAEAGLEHARKHHTYKHRIKDIIKICGLI